MMITNLQGFTACKLRTKKGQMP